MIAEGGGFAASLDADSEGEEGKFYVWTAAEIAAMSSARMTPAFSAHVYDVSLDGNFEGHTILNRLHSLEPLSVTGRSALDRDARQTVRARARRVSAPAGMTRFSPTGMGLMIAALPARGVVFDKPDWLELATRAFAFVVDQNANTDGRLWHSARGGIAKAPATASDYANMTWGALRLYQATGDRAYLDHAVRWTDDARPALLGSSERRVLHGRRRYRQT